MGLTSIRAYSKHDYTAQRRKNVVSRKFSVEMPNQIWVGDVAQHMVKGVYFYICVVIDLFSRKVLAYRVSSCCSAKMITLTFKTAYAERGYPKGLIFHSDQGTQYTSAAFRGLLSSNGVPVIIQFDVSRPNENGYRLLFFVQLFFFMVVSLNYP